VADNYQSMMIIRVCACLYIYMYIEGEKKTHCWHCSLLPCFAIITNWKILQFLLQ